MTEYVGQQHLWLDVRPKRAAFLFRTGLASQFRTAVEHASSRWGGLQEPIVPVSGGGRIQGGWRQIVEVLQPEVAFDVSGLGAEARRRAGESLNVEVLDIRREERPEYGTHVRAVTHEARTIFATTSSATGEVAGSGVLPSWDDNQDWANSGLPVEQASDPHLGVLRQIEGLTLIDTTVDQCGEAWGTGLSGGFALIWVAPYSSLRDALWFWNMRALMPRTIGKAPAVFVNPEGASHPKVGGLLRRRLSTGYKHATPDVVITSATLKLEELQSMPETLGLTELTEPKVSFHINRTRNDAEPLTSLTGMDPRRYLLGERGPGVSITEIVPITRPNSMFNLPSPVTFQGPSGGVIRARLSNAEFLEVPRRDPVARLFLPHAEWKHGGLEFESYIQGSRIRLDVQMPNNADVLVAALQQQEVAFELSAPGRIAWALSHVVNSAPELFEDLLAHEIIRKLTTPRSKRLVKELRDQLDDLLDPEAVERLAASLGPRIDRVYRGVVDVASLAGCKKADAAARLEKLVSVGLAERGLKATCDTCGMTEFVPLSRVGDLAVCSGCTSRAQYVSDATGVVVHYRLNALLDRASDQGVIPHLYVKAALEAIDRGEAFVHYGAILSRGADDLGEADVLGYVGRSIVCGEVKTTPEGFTSDEIAGAVRQADAVSADELVLGCVGQLPDDVIEESKARLADGTQLRIVDPAGNRVVA